MLISGTLTSAKTVRIEPPLVIEYDEIDEILDRLEDTLKAVSGAPVTGDVIQFPVVTPAVDQRPATTTANGHAEAATRRPQGVKSGSRHATRKAERSRAQSSPR